MKLDAWLKQGHPLEDRLLVIERLCQAVNEIHDRGDVVGGLEPGRIALGAEGQCDLSGARKRSSRPPYAPPEGQQSSRTWPISTRQEPSRGRSSRAALRVGHRHTSPRFGPTCSGSSPTRSWPASRSPPTGGRTTSRTSPRWPRPGRELPPAPPAASRAPLPPRATPKPVRRSGPSRRTWPLLVALVVVLGLAALAGRQYLEDIVGLFQPDATRASSAPERPRQRSARPGNAEAHSAGDPAAEAREACRDGSQASRPGRHRPPPTPRRRICLRERCAPRQTRRPRNPPPHPHPRRSTRRPRHRRAPPR